MDDLFFDPSFPDLLYFSSLPRLPIFFFSFFSITLASLLHFTSPSVGFRAGFFRSQGKPLLNYREAFYPVRHCMVNRKLPDWLPIRLSDLTYGTY